MNLGRCDDLQVLQRGRIIAFTVREEAMVFEEPAPGLTREEAYGRWEPFSDVLWDVLIKETQ